MIKIRALRQFSHYHAGNFDQFEERSVSDEIAQALVGMELAEEVEPPAKSATEAPKKTGGRK
ncbi:hypothetical protein HGO40_11330 [Pseudomonas sp. CG7]|jgi:hypothetical protein|uniref:hypothetical protein n=1 Tax=Pseudomonas sp. CG7 TaxID=191007 RepID=UPI002033FEF3|nr:hypothetical protein [Pseudomonas sp. CG7]MCM2461072.1 hypothetical protein [Pseudomonas sp. CG7]